MQSVGSTADYIYSEWRRTPQSWSQQHNGRAGSHSSLLVTLDPLLYGAYRNTDGLSNPGLSSTMAGPVHTLLSSDGAGITLDPLLYGAYRNTDGLSNPGHGTSVTFSLELETMLFYYVAVILSSLSIIRTQCIG